MKKWFLTLILLAVMSSLAFADDCVDDEGCNNPPWDSSQVTLDYSIDCFMTVFYKFRTVNCNGQLIHQFRITSTIRGVDHTCGWLSNGPAALEAAIEDILGDPTKTPFPDDFPGPDSCNTNYVVSQAACWEQVERPTGPQGAGLYAYPCDDSPNCCKPYEVCVSPEPEAIVTVTALPYDPQSCVGVIGDESGQPCYQYCP